MGVLAGRRGGVIHEDAEGGDKEEDYDRSCHDAEDRVRARDEEREEEGERVCFEACEVAEDDICCDVTEQVQQREGDPECSRV